MTASCWNGFRLPAPMDSLKVRVLRIAKGRMNLPASSCPHCLRRLASAITSSRCFRSASARATILLRLFF
jgi:hypothetical protein